MKRKDRCGGEREEAIYNSSRYYCSAIQIGNRVSVTGEIDRNKISRESGKHIADRLLQISNRCDWEASSLSVKEAKALRSSKSNLEQEIQHLSDANAESVGEAQAKLVESESVGGVFILQL